MLNTDWYNKRQNRVEIKMDKISIIWARQFTDKIEQILHSPCNIPNKMFEMTIVVDSNLTIMQVKNNIPELLLILKRHSEIFKNVRLNIVNWNSDNNIINNLVPMSLAELQSYYDNYKQTITLKSYDTLMNNLKLFHARSKLIIIFTDGKYHEGPKEELTKLMQPFLSRKVMNVIVRENELIIK